MSDKLYLALAILNFILLVSCNDLSETPGSPDVTEKEYTEISLHYSSEKFTDINGVLSNGMVQNSDEIFMRWADRLARRGDAGGYSDGYAARQEIASKMDLEDPERLLLLSDALELYKEVGQIDPKIYSPKESGLIRLENEMEKSREAIRKNYDLAP